MSVSLILYSCDSQNSEYFVNLNPFYNYQMEKYLKTFDTDIIIPSEVYTLILKDIKTHVQIPSPYQVSAVLKKFRHDKSLRPYKLGYNHPLGIKYGCEYPFVTSSEMKDIKKYYLKKHGSYLKCTEANIISTMIYYRIEILLNSKFVNDVSLLVVEYFGTL